MKQYPIHSVEDFSKMVTQFMSYFAKREDAGLEFQSINIISKRYRKSKSSPQHRKYWALISDLKEGFEHCGYIYSLEELHEFVKRGASYTRMIETPDGKMVEVTKSIADKSDDINSKEINFLIEWIYEFSATKLNWIIEK